jgi:hypothetical protein
MSMVAARPSPTALRRIVLLPIACALIATLTTADAPAADATPGWEVKALAQPTNFSADADAACEATPTSEACDSYTLLVTNVGDAASSGRVTIADTLPAGVGAMLIEGEDLATRAPLSCEETPVQCIVETAVPAGDTLRVRIDVVVEPDRTGVLEDSAVVTGGGAASTATTSVSATIASEPAPFGIGEFDMHALNADGTPLTQAGAHPYALTTSFYFNTTNQAKGESDSYRAPEDVKDVALDLPAGLVADPRAPVLCPLYALGAPEGASSCPSASRIGSLALERAGGSFSQSEGKGSETTAMYDMAPPPGYPLEFGASYHGIALVMYGSFIRSAAGETLRLEIPGISQIIGVIGASLTFSGDQALFTDPESCSAPAPARLEVDTWQRPGQYMAAEAAPYQEVAGCERLSFEPALAVEPDVTEAEEPSGYTIDLDTPQSEEPLGLSTAELKRASVTLPPGVSLSPAGADGLQSCAATGRGAFNPGSDDVSPSGEDLGDPGATEVSADGLYHTAPGICPMASKVGTVTIKTPLLAEPLEGGIFIAEPGAVDGSTFGLYLEAQGSGVILKLTGELLANQATGQLTLTFDELPQLPIGELQLRFFGGEEALLANPQECGMDSSSSELTPWSSPLTPDANSSSAFELSGGANGEACPNTTSFEPSLNAGTITPTAGAFSPFTLTISRSPNQQDLNRFSAQLPAGLTWLLSSVPACGEPAAQQGTCPIDSEIGTTEVGLGPSPYGYWVSGRVYLTEGYGGGQFGLSIALPLQLGPFDLGTAVVRAAIFLAPGTEALTIAADPLPQIVDGVPLRIKTLNLTIDRPEFALNPTECAARQILATIEGVQGGRVEVSNPFFTPGCQAPPTTPTSSPTPTGPGTPAPAPAAQSPKPSISHIEEHRLRNHVVVTFTTSAAGSVTITGRWVRTYRKKLPAGRHRIALTLIGRVDDGRSRRSLHLVLTLATHTGSVSAKSVFAL